MQTIRQVLLFEEKRENDIVKESDIQLYAYLLPEELLNETRHYFFSLKEVLVIVC
jgi:hypothetical protein